MTWQNIPGWFNWAPFYDRAIASAPHGSTLFVIGGEALYRECVLIDGGIPCSKVYLTIIGAEAQGDARFPYDELVSDVHGWKMIDSEPHEDKQGQMHTQPELAGLQYTFGTYVRGK